MVHNSEKVKSNGLVPLHVCSVCGDWYVDKKCRNPDHKTSVFLGGKILKKKTKGLKRMLEMECSIVDGSGEWSDQQKLDNLVANLI